MCAISGFSSVVTKDHTTIISGLLWSGTSRGTDATGIAYTAGRKWFYSKKRGTPEGMTFPARTRTVLLHNRFETKGTHEKHENNHPIHHNGHLLIHNGMITNDEEVKESNKLEYTAEVDTAVIIHLIDVWLQTGITVEEAIKETCSELMGSFAVAFVTTREPERVYLFRHNNPCVLGYSPVHDMVVWASTELMVDEAFGTTTIFQDHFFLEEKAAVAYAAFPDDSGVILEKGKLVKRFTIEAKKYAIKKYEANKNFPQKKNIQTSDSYI